MKHAETTQTGPVECRGQESILRHGQTKLLLGFFFFFFVSGQTRNIDPFYGPNPKLFGKALSYCGCFCVFKALSLDVDPAASPTRKQKLSNLILKVHLCLEKQVFLAQDHKKQSVVPHFAQRQQFPLQDFSFRNVPVVTNPSVMEVPQRNRSVYSVCTHNEHQL